jgi:hypothetical protein
MTERWRWWGGFALAVAVPLALYLPTIYPTYCFFSDSGDFMAAATLLMLPHPTGYPWFCLLNKLFVTLFPFGTVVWRFGFLTALFAPLTSGVVFLLVLRLTDHWLIALATAWTMAFGRLLWFSSVASEVYSSNLFLTMLALYALVRFWETGDRRWFFTVTLLIGFGMAHHLTLPLMALGGLCGLFLAWRWLPQKLGVRDWAIAVLIGCLPLAYYAYLPLRAPKPYGARYWQNTGDDPSKSLRDFVRYVFGQRFRYEMGALSWRQQVRRFGEWLSLGVQQYGALFGMGIALGWLLVRAQSAFWFVTSGMWLAHMAFYLSYDVPDIAYFFIPAWSLAVLWGGLVAHRLWAWLRQRQVLLALIVLGLAFSSVEVALINALPSVWGTDKERGKRYLDAVLRDTPSNAALVVSIDDTLFNLWALQAIEERRRDVRVVSVYEWQPTIPLQRPVALTTADIYRFFNPHPWFVRPKTPWVAELSKTPPVTVLRRCEAHRGVVPVVHSAQLLTPPDGVHVGGLLVARTELCVDSDAAPVGGYLWLLARRSVIISDANSPASGVWGWWWFYQPFTPVPKGRWLVRMEVGLPVISTIPPGECEVRGLPVTSWQLPRNATQMQTLWRKAQPIGIVTLWGR